METAGRDDTRYLLLATIGEIRDGRAAEEFARFIWLLGDCIAPVAHEPADGCGFGPGVAELLKARVAEHPMASVRAAAVDAHLCSHDHAAEEMERLRGRLRSDEAHLVGLPRFSREAS